MVHGADYIEHDISSERSGVMIAMRIVAASLDTLGSFALRNLQPSIFPREIQHLVYINA